MKKLLKTEKRPKEAGPLPKISVLAFSKEPPNIGEWKGQGYEVDFKPIHSIPTQEAYQEILQNCQSETVVMLDTDRFPLSSLSAVLSSYSRQEVKEGVYYYHSPVAKGQKKITSLLKGEAPVYTSPLFIGKKETFRQAYAAGDLSDNVLEAVGYSLQKSFVKFRKLVAEAKSLDKKSRSGWGMYWKYSFRLPFLYLISGHFFREIFRKQGKVQRNMVYRMLLILFAVFTFIYMPVISRDYGVTGDEFPDHRHTAYVLDYFAKGDKAALDQPRTTLHLYGISMQVVAGAICRWFRIENYYELRHVVCALNGALGVLFVGLAGLRWGGGLCGLLSILLMFFTPRYFGHSMNNLKDIPFAAGYIVSIYYTIRLFDTWPVFRFRYMLGLILGIALALGTRSGGLVLYPMLFMYAGLFYVGNIGWKEFYKFGKYRNVLFKTIGVLGLVVLFSYLLAIALWPFALQKPFSNVLFSLQQFTNYSIGLKTIFDGEQMMSNMLPWKYAPKYLMIGMPVVILLGFWGYFLYLVFRRKEWNLISYFFLFSALFPVFWVIYKNSNLYGGIRHLLFVMPPLVVLSGRFWQLSIEAVRHRWAKLCIGAVFTVGLVLPATHMVKNHPNDYVYFNELTGGLKGAYGDYETDYYYNSLKEGYDWFRKNVDLPRDRKTTIVTNHLGIVSYYFRRDTNVKVIYSRYYEKYAKDWDYAMFANVYINRYQLKHGLFPPEGTIYTPTVDGYPMTVVLKRAGKEELEGYRLEAERKYGEALEVFKNYVRKHPKNEEVLSRITKLSYFTDNLQEAEEYGKKALALQPALNEALYILSLTYLKGNKLPEALNSAQAIVDENAFSVDGLYLKALVYDRMKNHQEAIQYVNKALGVRPDHVGALALGGDILFRFGNYRSAVDIYKRLLKVQTNPNDLVRLADCYCRLKEYASVQQVLKQAEGMQGVTFMNLKVRLRMAIQQKEWKTAEEILRYVANVGNDAEIFVLRGLYCYERGRQGDALSMMAQALRLDPENKEAIKWDREWKRKI